MTSLGQHHRAVPRQAAGTLLILGICIVWASWSVLAEMWQRWEVDPTFAHGYLVPVGASAILWARRMRMPSFAERPDWWGIGIVALGMILQMIGAYYYIRWLCGAAIIAYLLGAVLLVGGWPVMKWAAPGIGFLVFMIPLPYRVDVLMRQPLQRISALGSGAALQMLGLPAVVEGNTIVLDDVVLGVVDACSGIKMLVLFFCLSTGMAILVRRNLGERILILLSAVPIAIICNTARITVTGVMYVLVGEKWANLVFHDLAGWLMMPLALALLWFELWLLSILFVAPKTEPGGSPGSEPRSVPNGVRGTVTSIV